MPKELTISLNNQLVPITIEKVDRSDLYGQINSEMLDAGVQCTRVQVLMDGTILAPKSTAKALLVNDFWIEEQDTKRYTQEGREMVKQESSFKVEPKCYAANIEELLNYCVKSVYTANLENRPQSSVARFDFNYTAGYPKTTFLLTGADGVYMLIGEPAQCSWVGHQDFCLTGETDEEWTEEDMEEMFG